MSFTGPVNLGNPGEFTMLELANLVLELTGSKSRIVFGTLPEDDPRKRRPDITLAKTEVKLAADDPFAGWVVENDRLF